MRKETIVIIDYGSGNLRSAAKAFEHVARDGITVKISNKPEDILRADRIVLPGQGAFRDCMEHLSGIDGMVEAMNEAVLKKATPFLGICVGMQLLASQGVEHGVTSGLGWIEGEVVPIAPNDSSLKIPHMGWNDLQIPTKKKASDGEPHDSAKPAWLTQDNHSSNDYRYKPHFVLRSTEVLENFYFVHSFMFQCRDSHNILATTNYGGDIPAIIGRDNILGIQFHPEKSSESGLKLLSNFMDWKP